MDARTALVVVNYGSHDMLGDHLVATAAGTDATVVVVDNPSTTAEREAVSELAATHGWQLVLPERNGGFGAGVNAGVRRARTLGCDVVVLLQPDQTVETATVAELVASVRADPTVVVSPVILRPDGRVWFRGGSLDLATGRARPTGEVRGTVPWISTACLALDAALFERAGCFDEDYFLYWEDVDLSWRLRAAGARFVVRDDLVATHDVGGTQESTDPRTKSLVYYRYVCRGRLLFAAKHLDRAGRRRWALTAAGAAWEVVLRGGRRQLLRSPAPVLAAARGTLDGLGELRRRPTAV
ncbi:glycosyltransferase family 2 protein [Cellulomonas sp. KRMCY2]|uniref:glycosyltransferase family 2 protein n=1 Tax=Cellulomonas sp. KRMCY2 TaxID=1304865 RepID=UPI00045E90EC|nr:glycosyltransferase family 2 protein [Cellulomonas sp. KRMCY2]